MAKIFFKERTLNFKEKKSDFKISDMKSVEERSVIRYSKF